MSRRGIMYSGQSGQRPSMLVRLQFLFFVVSTSCQLVVAADAEEDKNRVDVNSSGLAEIVYESPQQLAVLANRAIKESSGLAVSRLKGNVFWTHNDSGYKPRIYAFSSSGKHLGMFRVRDAQARDWEDMSSFMVDGKSFLLLADVGDNQRLRTEYWLYLVEEFKLDRPIAGELEIPLTKAIRFMYEDGSHNSESVAFDPTTNQVVLVTKARRPEWHVYILDWPTAESAEPHIAKRIATLKAPIATAMDISPDGRRAIVLTRGADGPAFEVTRPPGEDWATAFSRPTRKLTMPLRKAGESICYGRDGKTLYLTSEKVPTPLWKVPVKK